MSGVPALCTLYFESDLRPSLARAETYDAAPRVRVEEAVFALSGRAAPRRQLRVRAINEHVTLHDTVCAWASTPERAASLVRTWLRLEARKDLVDPSRGAS